ncbi:MAG: GxxExxY protein [Candidatus Levybacteria bacterium]|nr:GxxExxY protein [Candidatus Levybacteria bacterium]
MPRRLVEDFLYPDLTYKIRGLMYKIHKTLGSGHKENIYCNALEREFTLQKIQFDREKVLPVVYETVKVGIYRPDFLVEDKLILEIKAVSFLPQEFERQLSYYLRGTIYKLGLLVNFGNRSLIIKRMIWDKARQPNQLKSA